MFSNNPGDINYPNSIQLATKGGRSILAKLTFAMNNVNSDAQAVITAQLLVNNAVLPTTTAECTLSGPNGICSLYVNAIYEFAAGDIVKIQAKVGANNLTMGSVVVNSEECCIYASFPNTRKFIKYQAVSSSSYVANPATYTDVVPESIEFSCAEFSPTKSVVAINEGGTVQYLLQATVDNNDVKIFSGLLSLFINTSSEGFKEVPGSTVMTTLKSGASQTIFSSGTLFVAPHSTLKARFLAPDGGNVLTRPGRLTLYLVSYENTRASFVGTADFGRFWKYVADDQEVLSTSTDFALRLAAVTIDLPGGKYRMGMTFEWDMSNAGVGFETQIVLDGSVILDSYSIVPVITGAYQKVTSFQQLDLGAGKHSFAFNTRVLEPTRALYTRNVRLEFWKL